MLVEEFMEPLGPTQGALAEAMGVHRKHANELCNGRRAVTAATALILARVFGNRPESWLNVQRRTDLWETMHSPGERERFRRTRLLPVRSFVYEPPFVDHYLTCGTARHLCQCAFCAA